MNASLQRLISAMLAGVLSATALMAASPAARADERLDPSGHDWRDGRRAPVSRDPRGPDPWTMRHVPPDRRWYDNANGHGRYYPAPGWQVAAPPRYAAPIVWGGVNYRFTDGIWYSAAGPRWAVVRPPRGIVVGALPAFATAVVIGGLTYLYLNGTYYRERGNGGYEVVDSPVDGSPAAAGERLYVYPRQGQSSERQAKDEYECHRWAVDQTGFDPTGAATGQRQETAQRDDYSRAQRACLEGRGYTVR